MTQKKKKSNEVKPDSSEVRLQKYIAGCGEMSRRAAERMIEEGRVRVDGKRASLGDKIIPGASRVEIDGKPVFSRGEGYKYIMLNKPRGCVTTMSDQFGRRTVADLVSDCPGRLYPVGRLDYNSEGMLILTNDGDLANKMMHPSGHIKKYYRVRYNREPTDSEIELLMAPHVIDGYKIKPVTVTVDNDSGEYVNFELSEGRNREIRKISERAGLLIKRLKRVGIGKLRLGDLPVGKWRYLSADEVKYLKNNAGKED